MYKQKILKMLNHIFGKLKTMKTEKKVWGGRLNTLSYVLYVYTAGKKIVTTVMFLGIFYRYY
jgi:hypothetical protein